MVVVSVAMSTMLIWAQCCHAQFIAAHIVGMHMACPAVSWEDQHRCICRRMSQEFRDPGEEDVYRLLFYHAQRRLQNTQVPPPCSMHRRPYIENQPEITEDVLGLECLPNSTLKNLTHDQVTYAESLGLLMRLRQALPSACIFVASDHSLMA